jgi:hypothetical protein
MEVKASIRGYLGYLWIKIMFHELSRKIPEDRDQYLEMMEGSPWWISSKGIARGFIPPGFCGRTVSELAGTVPKRVMAKAKESQGFCMERDIQLGEPRVALILSRVGVTNLERIIRLGPTRDCGGNSVTESEFYSNFGI